MTTQSLSREDQVLSAFEERRRSQSGEQAPFDDVLDVLDYMRTKGSELDDLNVGVAVARLVCSGRLRYALDGIRLRRR